MTPGTTLRGGRFKVTVDAHGQRTLHYLCPACGICHNVRIDGLNAHTWNEDGDQPTITPGVLFQHIEGVGTCHHSVTRGMLVFHPDSQHALRGQSAPMLRWHTED